MSSKRKEPESVSPLDEFRTSRRRFLTGSPTFKSSNIVITMSSPDKTSANEDVSSAPTHHSHPSSLEVTPEVTQGFQFSMNDLTQMVMVSMSHPDFLNTFAPLVADVLNPLISKSFLDAIGPLQAKVDLQGQTIASQQDEIKVLQKSNSELEARITGLEQRISSLEESDLDNRLMRQEAALEELEQYGRRNSLRFHNIKMPEDNKDSDEIIVNICNDKLNANINKDDICRSHPVGHPNKHGKVQLKLEN
ncbi:hypothetical protein FSP39_010964 [Pinctada imbricata]|uniref:Uncharacterized protein n=1 Tax=Pinctada imbricata TaxID=66713 RepID=A0AA88YEB9_PINIB|nr:hypothetical protein FSP39_010964 [Pinctada imbricata]